MLSKLKTYWEKFSGLERKLLLIFVVIIAGSWVSLSVLNRRTGISVPKIGGTYTEGLVGVPLHINPLLAPVNDVDMDLTRVVYSGLLKFDHDLNILPDLAETLPEISSDGKSYTLRLKSNLTWQDGAELTADDVVFTFKAVQNQELRSPLRLSWNKVDVEKLDTTTVKITTRESSASFIANLTLGILPKHLWEAVPVESFALSRLNLEPVGSGPYQVTEIRRGRNGEVREMKFLAFSRYHGEGPYIKNLNFKFYPTASELIDAYQGRDIMGLGYIPFDQSLFIQPKNQLRQQLLPLPQYQAVFINRVKNPAALEDPKVRLALAKSVDKTRLMTEVYGNQVSEAFGPILPGHLGYHEQIPGADMNIYDVERSRALLEESEWILDPGLGFRKDKQDRIITVSLVTNNFAPNVRVAQLLKEMWENIGIQVILNIETIADLEDKFIRPRNYELLLFSENVGPDPDPYSFWHSSQLRDPGLNLSTFANKNADKLLIDARANIAPQARATKYREFQEIFVGDVPAIFLNRSVFVYNLPTDVQGVNLNTVITASERFANINEWFVETRRVKQ